MKSLRRSLNNEKRDAGGSSSGSAMHTPPFSAPGHGSSQMLPSSSGSTGQRSASDSTINRPSAKIQPPQKVIKALTAYRSEVPQFLGYQKGDFFYVTGEKGGDTQSPEGWYEALNPLTGSRGRVRKSHFEEFNKGGRPSQSRQGGQLEPSAVSPPATDAQSSQIAPGPSGAPASSSSSQTYNPGQAQTVYANAATNMSGLPSSSSSQRSGESSAQSSTSAMKTSQPLYAIVQYDFQAERQDELDAKAGEPIIVIAQSNHEWFVAKPISRLGGPGLIPVSFVEIRDPVTSKPIDNDEHLLARSLPPVESWKKATAEYKAASIPLGQIQPTAPVTDSRFQNMGQPKSTYGAQDSRPQTASHAASSSFSGPSMPSSAMADSIGYTPSPTQSSHAGRSSGGNHAGTSSSGHTPSEILSWGDVVSTHVKSFHFEAGAYWFRINAVFVPDDPSRDATALVLYRLYEDFYDFQIRLLDLFPREAGRRDPRESADSTSSSSSGGPAPTRILPYMPGPMEDVDIDITNARREDLDIYLRELLDLRKLGADYILRHEHVLAFFSPRPGDMATSISRAEAETIASRVRATSMSGSIRSNSSGLGLDQKMSNLRVRGSGGSGHQQHGLMGLSSSTIPEEEVVLGPVVEDQPGAGSSSSQPSQTGPSGHYDSQHSRQNLTTDGTPAQSLSNSRGPSPYHQQLQSPTSGHGIGAGSSLDRVGSSQGRVHTPTSEGQTMATAAGARSAGVVPSTGTGAGNSNDPPFIKIKVLDRTTEDMIAIRVPPRVTYEQLVRKVKDRLGAQIETLQYRVTAAGAEDGDGNGMGNLVDDASLQQWLKAESKLVLYAE